MSTLATLVVKLIGDASGFRSSIDNASETVRRAGESISAVGSSLTTRVTLPIVGMGVAAVAMGNQFNQGMANVTSLVPEAADDIAAMSDDVQQLAIDMGQATGDMTQGLYQQISATGYSAESLDMLRVNAMAAAAGLASTKEAIDLTSAVTKGYGDTTIEATQKVADLALRTVQLGQTTFPELAASMGRVVPIAANLGVAQEELFAVMATATGVTGGAAEVSTQLRGALQSLMAPTETMGTLIESMGFKSGQAMIEQLGLQGSIQAIVNAANASGTPLQSYMGSIEGQTLALALAGPQAETYKEKLTAMGSAAGTAQTAFDLQTQGVNAAGFAMQQASINLQTMTQDLGTALAPAVLAIVPYVQQFVTWVTGLVDQFTALDPQTQGIILGVIGLVAAIGPLLMILGPIVTGVGALIGVLGAVLSPIGLVVLAIGGIIAVGVLVVQHWDEIKAWLANLWNQISTAVTTKVEEIKTAITNWLQSMWSSITSFDLGAAASQLFAGVVTGIQTGISNAASAVLGWLDNTMSAIENFDLQAAAATFFGTTLPGIAEKAGQALTDVGTWLLNVGTSIANSSLVEDAKTWFGTTLPAIAEKAGQALTDVGTWLSNTADRIRNFDLKAAALNAFHTILPGIYEKTGEALNNVGTWLGDVASRIREKSFKSDTLNAFASVIAGIIEKASEIISSVGDFLEDIADKIRNFSLKDVAHQLIQGMIDGVREKWEELTSTIGGLLEGLVAWLKRLLGITSPSRVMADQIGHPLIEGIALGAQEAAPGALTVLVDIVTSMVSAMSDAASAMVMLGSVPGASGFISSLIAFISDLVRAFDVATRWMTIGVKAQADAFAAAAQEMLKTLQETINLLADIGSIQVPANGAAFVQPLIRFVSSVIQAMHEAISWITHASINVKAQADAFAAAALELLETLSAGVTLIEAIGNLRITTLVEGTLYRLVDLISRIVQLMSQRIAPLTIQALTAVRVFAEAAGPVLTTMLSAVDTINAIQTIKLVDVHRQVAYIADRIVGMVDQMRRVAGYLGTQGVAAARAFAEAAGPVLTTMLSAVDTINAIQTIKLVDVHRQVAYIADRIVGMVDQMRRVAGYLGTQGVAAARAFAEAAGPVLTTMLSAVDTINAIQTIKLVDVHRQVAYIADRIVGMVDQMRRVAGYLGTQGVAAARAFAEAAGPVLTTYKTAVDTVIAIQSIGIATKGSSLGVGMIAALIEQLVNALADVAGRAGGPLTGAAKRFAERVGPILGIVQSGVDALESLTGLVIPEPGVVNAGIAQLGNLIELLASTLADVASRIGDKLLVVAKSVAEKIEPVIGVVSGGVDAIAALGSLKVPEIGVINAGVGALGGFIEVLANTIADVASRIPGKLMDAAKEFAEKAAPVVGIVKGGVDAIVALKNMPLGFFGVSAGINRLGEFIEYVAKEIGRVAQTVDQELVDAAKEFAEKITAPLGLVRDALSLFKTLSEFTYSGTILGKLDILVQFVETLAQKLGEAAGRVDSSLLTAAREFAEAVREPLALLDTVVRTFRAVAAFDVSTGVFDKLDTVISHIWNVLRKIGHLRDVFTEDVLEDARFIVEVAVPAMQAIQQAMLMLAAIGQVDLSSLAVTAYNAGVNWIHELADGITSGMSYLEAALQGVANLFPHSPAKAGPLRQAPDWEGYMFSGLDKAGDTLVRRLTAAMPAGGRLALAPAGVTGARGGQTINVTIHNPKSQAAERSLRRELLMLSQLGVLE